MKRQLHCTIRLAITCIVMAAAQPSDSSAISVLKEELGDKNVPGGVVGALDGGGSPVQRI